MELVGTVVDVGGTVVDVGIEDDVVEGEDVDEDVGDSVVDVCDPLVVAELQWESSEPVHETVDALFELLCENPK